MKVGDYIRTKYGYLRKIIAIYNGYVEVDDKCFNSYANVQIENVDIKKSSPNIIDLVEVGDYVNGSKVIDIAQAPKRAIYIEDIQQHLALIPITNIYRILTKEQFELMEYKVC